MTNKATKYGLMTIAAVLLVAMAFAGAASAVQITAEQWNALGSNSELINGNASYEFTDTGIIYPKFNSTAGYDVNQSITFDFTNYTGTFYGEPSASSNCKGALFGNITNSSFTGTITIKNLMMTSVNVTTMSAKLYFGGVVGYFKGKSNVDSNLNFTNCTLVNCSIGSTLCSYDVGGLVGRVDSAMLNVEDCSAKHCDVVSCSWNVGGLVGYAADSASFVRCKVTNSTVASTAHTEVGGLVGCAASAIFDSCGVENTSVYANKNKAAGIAGNANALGSNPLMKQCYVKNCVIVSFGDNGRSDVAGLVGNIGGEEEDKIIDCYVVNCTLVGKYDNVGGLIARGIDVTVTGSGNIVEYCAVNGTGSSVSLDFGNVKTLSLDTPVVLNENFIYNNTEGYKDVIKLYNVSGSEITSFTGSMNKIFWKTIFNATAQKSGESPVQVTYLGNYGEVGGYGVGSAPTLTYNTNGATSGSAPASKTYAARSTVTIAEKGDLKKSGHVFAGWNTNAAGTGTMYQPGVTLTITEDLTLYANWSIIEYNITYNNMTGASNPEANPATYNVTSSTLTLENAYKIGYTFENWYNSTEFGDASRNKTIPTGSTGNKVFYANWTVNTTDVTASDHKAEFGNDNVTAIHSGSGIVIKVLPDEVNNVTNTAVKFTADNTSVGEIPGIAGYSKDEITIFDLNATAYGTAMINVTVTFANETIANATKDNIRFFHYNVSEWEPLKSTIVGVNNADVTYTVETTVFSPFGVGIYTPITYTVRFDANGGQGSMADMTFTYDQAQNLTANAFQRYNSNFLYWTTTDDTRYTDKQLVQNLTTVDGDIVVMKAEWEVYSTGGSSSGSTYMGSNSASYTPTQQPTVKPTVAPTTAPTEKPATPTFIATEKPTTQATQQSPAPFVGLLAGLGAAAVLLRLRK